MHNQTKGEITLDTQLKTALMGSWLNVIMCMTHKQVRWNIIALVLRFSKSGVWSSLKNVGFSSSLSISGFRFSSLFSAVLFLFSFFF